MIASQKQKPDDKKESGPTVDAHILATLFGLTSTRIAQLGKAGTLPKAKERGKYLLWPSVKNYIAALKNPKLNGSGTADGTEDPESLRSRREKKIDLECQKIQLWIDAEKGKYITRSEVDERDTKIGSAVAAFLTRYEREMPAVCLGLLLPQSQFAFKKRSDELRTLMADMTSEFWQGHPET